MIYTYNNFTNGTALYGTDVQFLPMWYIVWGNGVQQ